MRKPHQSGVVSPKQRCNNSLRLQRLTTLESCHVGFLRQLHFEFAKQVLRTVAYATLKPSGLVAGGMLKHQSQ